MATFSLIHGGGASAWGRHLVVPALAERGHDAVAVDLPCEDDSAGCEEYADAVVSKGMKPASEPQVRALRRESGVRAPRSRWLQARLLPEEVGPEERR